MAHRTLAARRLLRTPRCSPIASGDAASEAFRAQLAGAIGEQRAAALMPGALPRGLPKDIDVQKAGEVLNDALLDRMDGEHRFRVYDREGERCPRPGCRGRIRRIVQSGRSTFFCATCQR